MDDLDSKLPEDPIKTDNSWIWALLLILVGVLWLLHKMNFLFLDRWWSFLFLIPAIALFVDAWNLYQKKGNRLTRRVMDAINGGAFFTLLTVFFYMNQSGYWKIFLPVLLILVGIFSLFSAFLPKNWNITSKSNTNWLVKRIYHRTSLSIHWEYK